VKIHRIFLLATLVTLFLFNAKASNLSQVALYDSSFVIINKLIVAGNIKTKERVIIRELLFKTGDTLSQNQLGVLIEKSKENLLNTSLFNYVYINSLQEHQNLTTLYILVEERWYLWPYLIFEQADRNLSSFIHEQDWNRINYGLMLVKNNFRGRRETIKLKVRMGYKEQFQLYYDIPFFLNTQKNGLSVELTFFRQKKVQYNTLNDEPQLFGNYTQYMQQFQTMNLMYYYRNKHYTTNKLLFTYSHAKVADTISRLNPNYFTNGLSELAYFTLSYIFEHDKRNYRYYPLTGYNIDFALSKKGLGILDTQMPAIWEMQTSAYTYFQLLNRWYTGGGAKIKISTPKKQPYFIERALGYDELLRAFEYNLIDGQSYATTRAFLKYEIVPKRVKIIQSWKWSKFNKIHYALYGNLFFDQGYVYDVSPDPSNKLPNKYLYSFGAGIDLVTYYDQILRLEYSVNPKGNHGFFIHMGKAF
jgi:outer membrane protein assembly factor BamA